MGWGSSIDAGGCSWRKDDESVDEMALETVLSLDEQGGHLMSSTRRFGPTVVRPTNYIHVWTRCDTHPNYDA